MRRRDLLIGAAAVCAMARLPALAQVSQTGGGIGSPVQHGPPVSAGSWALNSDNNNGVAVFEFRSNVPSLAAGGSQIRATFAASNTAPRVCTHASIGKTATAPSTLVAPVELLFSGASGFSLSPGQSITSDWLDFPTSAGDNVMIICDMTTTNTRDLNPATGIFFYFKAGSTEWNVASVSGFGGGSGVATGLSSVEVRS